MTETHRIIVLNSIKYGDDKIIVNALSRSAGRVSLVVRVVNNRRATVRHSLFHPLAILEVEWEASPRTTMFRPKSAYAAVPLLSLQCEPEKATVAMFLAEFLGYATTGDFDGGLLFDYIAYALEWFDAADRDYANFHLIFLLRLSRLLGIDPNVDVARRSSVADRTPALPYFNLQEGEYTAARPAHAYYIEGAEATAIPTLLRFNFATMHLLRLNGAQRSRILEAILTYYRLHFPGIPELKSLDVLRAVYKSEE